MHAVISIEREPCLWTSKMWHSLPSLETVIFRINSHHCSSVLLRCAVCLWGLDSDFIFHLHKYESSLSLFHRAFWWFTWIPHFMYEYQYHPVWHRLFKLPWLGQHIVPEYCFLQWDAPSLCHDLDCSVMSLLYAAHIPLIKTPPSVFPNEMQCIHRQFQ